MTTQLSLYNDAIVHVGERPLVSLVDNTEPRRILDTIWPGVRDYCLEQGHWKFAQRSAKLSYSTSITPAWGFARAFPQPADFVRLSAFCSDEFFTSPVSQFREEAGVYFTTLDTIYLQYVSNDVAYGYDLSLWPESFSLYVSLYLAWRSGTRISAAADRDQLGNDMERARLNALAKDAVSGPTQFLPIGNWASTRTSGTNRGRNSKSSLYG